ncbi:MAG: hypothetical protein MRJ65_11390 [Candidatus Brocadiaceae bacterium]|nr:hypothetical protein [Candidatus Brocadiaceae bacterium]
MSRLLLIFLIVIAMAMFVVWERNKIIVTGYQVARLQKSCMELSEKNRKLNYFVCRLKEPKIIISKVELFKIPIIPGENAFGVTVVKEEKSREVSQRTIKISMKNNLYTEMVLY